MGVRVMFLGRLRDLASGEESTLPAPLTWQSLLDALPSPLAETLQDDRIRVACGGELLTDKARLYAEDGAEVALLPPVSGG